jgi:hypothetical protein
MSKRIVNAQRWLRALEIAAQLMQGGRAMLESTPKWMKTTSTSEPKGKVSAKQAWLAFGRGRPGAHPRVRKWTSARDTHAA